MWISTRWLSRHVDLDGVDLRDLGDRFTLSVAELECTLEVGELPGVVVGHVLTAEGIEGTKLTACQVDTGDETPRSIVCGAPNVAPGQRVPVVLPGSRLGDLKIGERQVHGHLSQGMIASERELGLGEAHEGIMVLEGDLVPGAPIREALETDDVLFEIDNKSLTHRPDLWGHRGLAREVAALLGRDLRPLEAKDLPPSPAPLTIEVKDPQACPRYAAVTVGGLKVGPSPFWLRLLLHRVGVRSINNVVDATNFVMLDLGNPLHAFDRRQIAGDRIEVRRARAGETFSTLDDQERRLTESDLLICDGERAVALAGIMGGQNSQVEDDTTDLVLEVANFSAATVRRTSQRLGLRTDSSTRFEKSLDPHLVSDAARLCCELLLELSPGAEVTSGLMDVAAPVSSPPVIDLAVDLVHRRLGICLGQDRIVSILSSLTFGVEVVGDGHLQVTVPTFRATRDISIAEDLIEEVGRSFGYDNIPPTPPRIELGAPHPNHRKRFERAARHYMASAAGLDEVMTYSFSSDPLLDRIDARPPSRLELKNPTNAEMPGLRTELGTNLLGVLERNGDRESRVDVFEVGRVFLAEVSDGDLPDQPTLLGALVARGGKDEGADDLFGHMKAILLGLCRAVERPVPTLCPGGVDKGWAHPVRQASLELGGVVLGSIYEVHPLILHRLDLRHSAVILEVDLDAWRAHDPAPAGYRAIPRYPAVYRDYAVVVDEGVPSARVEAAIQGASPEKIEAVDFQSVYRGAGVPEGRKSMAYAVTLRWLDGTLDEGEVQALEVAIWSALAKDVQGQPRA